MPFSLKFLISVKRTTCFPLIATFLLTSFSLTSRRIKRQSNLALGPNDSNPLSSYSMVSWLRYLLYYVMPALARQVSVCFRDLRGQGALYITTEAGRGPRYTRNHYWYLCRGTEDQKTVWDFRECSQCGGLSGTGSEIGNRPPI